MEVGHFIYLGFKHVTGYGSSESSRLRGPTT
jgi:hypothetical protein